MEFLRQLWPQRTLDYLAANRPDITTVDTSYRIENLIPRMNDEVAVQLGLALRENTVVTKLVLKFGYMTINGAQWIAPFIARGDSPLRELVLVDSEDHIFRADMNPDFVRVVDHLLISAGTNGRIEEISIGGVFGVPAFEICMNGLRTSLKIMRLNIPFAMNDEDLDATADAIPGLASLECLLLAVDPHSSPRIINRLLGRHLRLKYMHVFLKAMNNCNGTLCSRAVRNWLLSATPPEQLFLEYDGIDNISDHGLEAVFAGLHGHNTLRGFGVNITGGMVCAETAQHVANMLRNNRSVESLFIFGCWNQGAVATILEPLAGTGANDILEELTLRSVWEYVDDDDHHERMIRVLPHLKHLKSLVMDGFAGPNKLDLEKKLVRAFELNLSLTHVELEPEDAHEFFTLDEHYEALEYYATRNLYHPLLAGASKTAMLLTVFPDVQADNDELTALSIMFDTLRVREDWYVGRSTSRNNKKCPRSA